MCTIGIAFSQLKTEKKEIFPVHNIIPQPNILQISDDELIFKDGVSLIANKRFYQAEKVIKESIIKTFRNELSISNDSSYKCKINLVFDKDLAKYEYKINIDNSGISLKANDPAGAFYAAQTLNQLLWSAEYKNETEEYRIQSVLIDDKPNNYWRGFHLDVSRHFFTKEYIKKIIDWMATYKLNKLHLHLTDDQGWRIQIDKYPLLTEIGAWRTFNKWDSICMKKAEINPDYKIDERFVKNDMYGGYYSKQDMKEIIDYASSRFIEIIPEIDMPGHMSAAIRAYPYLSCTDSEGWGNEFSFPICPCKENVMDFVYNVWDEIIELFPSKTIHIGADEVEKDTWVSSDDCQEFIAQHGMMKITEIQNYFVKKLQSYLESKGKTVIAWDDVIDGQVDSNLLIMYWRDYMPDSPLRTAQNGNNIILTPWSWFYLSGDHTDKSLKDLYEYDAKKELDLAVISKIIGFQACVWTETIPSEPVFEYYVFPRFQAFSEVAWSIDKNWESFNERMDIHYKTMQKDNINFRKPDFIKTK